MKSIWRNCLLLVAAAALCALVSSCATTGDDEESDLPWNSQQPWERTLNIPGMGGADY